MKFFRPILNNTLGCLLFLGTYFLLNTCWALNDEDKFNELNKAFAYWLNTDNSENITTISKQDVFQNYCDLPFVAVHRLLQDTESPWLIRTIAQYDLTNARVNLDYAEIPVDNFNTKERVPGQASYYFIYSKANPEARIIIVVNFAEIIIYAEDSKISESLAFEKEYNRFLVEKNFYRNGVLEVNIFRWPHCIHFLTNVDDYNFSWDDLILDTPTKSMCHQSTTEFLNSMKTLYSAGVTPKKGLLLYGPPGTGKSFLGQILISELLKGKSRAENTFYVITARHLSDYTNANKILNSAKDLSPSTLFFEDIDLLGVKNRDGSSPPSELVDWDAQTLLNELLNGLDGLTDSNGVLTIATTNKPDNIDSALLRSGRIGLKIFFKLPQFFERKEFFERFGKSKAVWDTSLTLDWLASESEGFSGSDIIECITLAKQFAYMESSFTSEHFLLLKVSHFQNALNQIREQLGQKAFLKIKEIADPTQSDKNYFHSLRQLRAIENR